MGTKNDAVKFVVVGIRHFENGEHHWFAPSGVGMYEDTPEPFGGRIGTAYRKPLFDKMEDAENWAMSMVHGAWRLAQWETRRPTFIVVEKDTYISIVENVSYAYPEEAEKWSDAKMDDFERECDCEDFMNQRLWDSDTDAETDYAREQGWCDDSTTPMAKVIEGINKTTGLSAYEDEGLLAVEKTGEQKQAVADAILEVLPIDLAYKLEWVKSDEATNTAWFKVDGFDPMKTFPLGKEG